MCLPVLAIAGLAAMAGGAGLKYFGDKKADHAVYKTFSREQDRQKAFQAEEVAKFQDSLNSTQGLQDPAAQAAAEARRTSTMMAAAKGSSPASGAYLPGSKSAAPVVANHAAEAGKAADAKTAGLAHALAILGGMGDMMQQNSFNIAHDSQAIGQIGGFRSGSLGVLPAEMEAAKHKGQTLRTLGGLAQGIGQMMLSGGMPGGAGMGNAVVNMGTSPVAAGGADLGGLLGILPKMAI